MHGLARLRVARAQPHGEDGGGRLIVRARLACLAEALEGSVDPELFTYYTERRWAEGQPACQAPSDAEAENDAEENAESKEKEEKEEKEEMEKRETERRRDFEAVAEGLREDGAQIEVLLPKAEDE